MSAFPSNPSLDDEHSKGTVRFKWDGAKWKRLGQNFDRATLRSNVVEDLGDFSYSGHLETVEDKSYTLDVRMVSNRTVTEFYGVAASGGCTATLSSGGVDIGALTVGVTGATVSLSNASITAGASLDIVVTGNNSCTDFKFVVGYTV